jgi:acyl-CoA thioesterase I
VSGLWRWGLAVAVIAGLGSLFLVSPLPKEAADRQLSLLALPGRAPVAFVFMGTSLTAGDPWPDLVVERLQACVTHPLRAQRIAEGGVTSAWGLSQIEAAIAAAPNLLLLEFAINDADLRHGLSLEESRDNHRAMLARLKEGLPEARIILMTTNPATGLRRLLRPRLAAYYAQYRTLAAEMDVGLIDLYPRWLALPRAAQGLTDGVHPAPDRAALVIVPVVTAYLGGVLGKTCMP